jgi:ribosomal 30S subunit maturation factor RimM
VVAIEVGLQDRLVIHDVDARIERLLPVVDAFLADIDLDAAVITITPPDGIPEDPLPEPRGPREPPGTPETK